MTYMSECPWLATVIYRDGTREQRRCATREEAEAWRDVRLDRVVAGHSVVRTTGQD